MGADEHVGAVAGLVGRDEVGAGVDDRLHADRDVVGLAERLGGGLHGVELDVVGPDDQVLAAADGSLGGPLLALGRGLGLGLGRLLGRRLAGGGLLLGAAAPTATGGEEQGR
ncbi:hypothetical protein [Serinibacter arcticus]|uniref:hypothetical protein n=1 Tax=Serinibacter arcticus TaxID=1655435 RepID=UPI001F199993|nr:hypothetical protein [Serinibacter arcticus]